MDYENMKFTLANDTDRGLSHRGCGRQDCQLNTYDWLADVPGNAESTDLVEVQFKNTRKGYYHNVNHWRGDTYRKIGEVATEEG